MYLCDADRSDAQQRTAEVIKEVKTNSGKSFRDLSTWLESHHVIISADMLRQHSCGKKIMGPHRLFQVARAAHDNHFSGDRCLEILMFHDPDQRFILETLQRDSARYKLAVEKRLYQCVRQLYEAGLSIPQILAMVARDCDLVEVELAAR